MFPKKISAFITLYKKKTFIFLCFKILLTVKLQKYIIKIKINTFDIRHYQVTQKLNKSLHYIRRFPAKKLQILKVDQRNIRIR